MKTDDVPDRTPPPWWMSGRRGGQSKFQLRLTGGV